jgi:hypothetical protein
VAKVDAMLLKITQIKGGRRDAIRSKALERPQRRKLAGFQV